MSHFRSFVLCGLVTGSSWWLALRVVHPQWVAPEEQRALAAQRESTALVARLESARERLRAAVKDEARVLAIRRDLEALHRDLPTTPALTWFPQRLKAQLAASGLTQATIRLNAVAPVPEFPGYETTYWHVLLPPQPGLGKVADGLLAVDQIAGQDRFVEVLDYSFRTGNGEPPTIVGWMNVMAFVPK